MELIKKISSKVEFDNFLRGRNIFCQFVSFIDNIGEQNFVYMVKGKGAYSLELCEGCIIYNESRKLSRDEIESRKKEEFLKEPFGDGVLYEIDTYPMGIDGVIYPITDVRLLDEDEMIKELVLIENNSILNMFFNGA